MREKRIKSIENKYKVDRLVVRYLDFKDKKKADHVLRRSLSSKRVFP